MFNSLAKAIGLQQEKKEIGITPELIRSIIDEIEADPYAGLGAISKKAMLIDRLVAVFRMHSCLARGVPVTVARPLITEPPLEAAPPASNVTVSRPTAVKKAEPAKAEPTAANTEQKAMAV